ncbi:ankyrin repeat domain-containing protein [Fusobacterium hwasookii]|uniref:ankyrin repeat domain-containing protein n=1 Tax=Fusobacterium hwasookii TaxID=1583098 RepID=UPI0016287081|nr:ankyrin repeat domain-containing protein [Fusobacterium hwasookii]QNE65898.1 ankyrin repeat domain-containing protein [Fusobacterium hwasookii]
MKKIGKFKTIGEILKNFVEITGFNLGFELENTTKKFLDRLADEKDIKIENFFSLFEELKSIEINDELFVINPYSNDKRIKKIDFISISKSIKNMLEISLDTFLKDYKHLVNNCTVYIEQTELDKILNSYLFIPFIKEIFSTIYEQLSIEKLFDNNQKSLTKKIEIFKSKLREIIGEKSIYVLENKNEGIYKFISNLDKKDEKSSKVNTIISFIEKLNLSQVNENEVFLFLVLFSIEKNFYKKFKIKDETNEIQEYSIYKVKNIIENQEKREEYLKEEELINEMKNVVGNLNSKNYQVSKEKIEKIYKKDTSGLLQYFKDYYYGRFLAKSGEEKKGLDKYFDSLKEAKYRAGKFLENILIEGMILAFRVDSKKYKNFYNYTRFMGIVTKEHEGDNDWINKHYFQYFDRYFSPIFEKDEKVDANDYEVLGTGEKLVEDKALSIKDLRSPNAKYKFNIREETRLSIFSRLPANIIKGYTEEYIQLCMVKLLEEGADINYTNSTGETALMGAIAYKNYERAKLLLKYSKVKETINQKSLRKKNTVISLIIEQFVVFGGFLPFEMKELLLELFTEILKYKPNLNQITTVNDVTYIRQIMQVFSQRENFYRNAYNNIDAWRREYQDNFDSMFTDKEVKDFIRKQEKMVNDPNFIKIMNKIFSDNRIYYLKLLDLLLKAGADINIKQQFGISDLMFAAELGDIELFKLLAKYNPNIKTMTNKGKNLFTNAMDYGNYDLAFYLLKEYPYFRKDIDYCSKDIQESSKISSLLGKFLEKHDIEKIKEMIEMGANINSKTAMKGITALIIAIETEDEDFIKFVLKKGADVNIKIQNKYLAIPGYFEYLEKYGNFADTANNGITPLMKACIIENFGIVKLLIEDYGAEINAKNDIQKWTALDFAMVTKNIEIIEYLKSKGAVSGIN